MAEPYSAAPISRARTKPLLQLHRGITGSSKAPQQWAEARASGKIKCNQQPGTHTPTFCGASCSGTSHSNSEAAGSCMPSNCFSKPMATASAELELRKEWDLDSEQSG